MNTSTIIMIIVAIVGGIIFTVVLAIFAWKWYQQKLHSTLVLVYERNEGKVHRTFVDWGYLHLKDKVVRFHLLKTGFEIKPPELWHFKHDAFTGQRFIELERLSEVDFRPLLLKEQELEAIDDDAKFWFVQNIKEDIKKGITGLNKFLPYIGTGIILIGLILAVSILGMGLKNVASEMMTGFSQLSAQQEKSNELAYKASENNLQLAKILGIRADNGTMASSTPPIG